ncbi:MAG: acyltransferase family protein [Actinomycetota bacterium]
MSASTQSRADHTSGQAAHREPGKGSHSFRIDIQGLRAVAVLLVVLYHVGGIGVSGGYVGVDVFFVLSGFLITDALLRELRRNDRISLTAFYARRIRRLLPMATLVLVTTLAIARLWGSVFQIPDIARDAFFVAIYGINYGLAAEGINYQQAFGPPSPLQHYWSLAVEEQFYVLWPVLIALCAVMFRRWRAGRTAFLTLLVTAICGVSLAYSITTTATNAPLAYFSLHTRAWELGVGALLALGASWLARIPASPATTVGSWVGLAAILWSGFTYTDETPFPGSAALTPVLGTAMVIACGFNAGSFSFTRAVRGRMLQGIGRISYGWYLWHWPFLILAPMLFGRPLLWWENLQLVALALWVSVLSYWILEGPALRMRLLRLRWFLAGISMASVTALAGGVLLVTVPSLVGSGSAAAAITLGEGDRARIKQAVIDGTTLTKAPSNLTPSLEQARDDQPASTRNGCHADFKVIGQGLCEYGDPAGDRTMVLIGDSHAQQWLPGLDAAAKKENWKLVSWTKAACSIADREIFSSELNREYAECVQWRERTIRRVIRLNPDRVVVSQSDLVPGTRVGNTDWAEATAATLRKLQDANLEVTYILDTPGPPSSMPDCVAEHLEDVGACGFPREKAYAYEGRHEAMAQTLTQAGVSTVEPIEWFCTNTDCPPIIGRYLVYRDDSHMSTSYSEWLAPFLGNLFTEEKAAA